MTYTKSELRNSNKPLLARLQRQVDKGNIPKIMPIKSIVPGEKQKFMKSFSSDLLLCDEEDKQILKTTRLGLYNRRKSR